MLDLTKNDGAIDAAAKSKALAVFEAATALIETRISAIRQCVEVEDTQVVIDTEALAARAAAWRAEVEEAIRIIEEATGIANAEAILSLAEKRHNEVLREWTPQIGRMEEAVKRVERDGGEELASVMKAGFKKDPVFAHLFRRNSRQPEKRFSFTDRLVAKWARFGEELAKYERTVAYIVERNEWLANTRKAISEANAIIEVSRLEYNEAERSARTLHDEAATVVERGWKTLVDLLSEGATEFAELDLDAACGVAREAAAAGVRNGTVVVPFAAEQEERLSELDARRGELKRHLERIAAIA